MKTSVVAMLVGVAAMGVSAGQVWVGVLSDEAMAESFEATMEVLGNAEGIRVSAVSGEAIRAGALDDLDVLLLPGGSGTAQCNALGPEGGALVEARTRAGMGVIGVCAGGYALLRREEGAFSNVQLVNAHLLDGEHWARGVGMLRVKAEGAEDDAGFEMQYYNGPLWTPPVDDTFPEYTVLARFVDDIHEGDAPEGVVPGTPAIVAAPFGGGRVVLFSPHPELTPGKGGLLVNAVKWAARGGLGEDEVISWGNVFGEK